MYGDFMPAKEETADSEFINTQLNEFLANNVDFKMEPDLIEIIKGLELNSKLNIELATKDKYYRKYLIPLVQKIDVFKKVANNWKEDEFKYIAERLKFKFYNEGENVFEYNDYGNLFYIIIDGTCSIQVPHNDKPHARS